MPKLPTNSHRIGYISGKILAVIGLLLFRDIKVNYVVFIHGMNDRKTKVRSYSIPSHPDDITINSSGVNVKGTSIASISKIGLKN